MIGITETKRIRFLKYLIDSGLDVDSTERTIEGYYKYGCLFVISDFARYKVEITENFKNLEEINVDISDLYMKNYEKLTKYLLDVSFHVLHDDFGFGDMRLTKYKDAMISQLECIADDYVDWTDFAGNIKMVEK